MEERGASSCAQVCHRGRKEGTSLDTLAPGRRGDPVTFTHGLPPSEPMPARSRCQVLSSADGFDPNRGRAIGWLYGVGGYVASSMRRHRSRSSHAEQHVSGRALLDPDDYARVEEGIDAAARLRQTFLAMDALPEQDRKILELVAVDELTTGQAAHALGISPVAARVRVSRARNRLRASLSETKRSDTQHRYTTQEGSA